MIAEAIYDWATRTPDNIALIQNGVSLSYRHLSRLISRARAFFVRRGCLGDGYAFVVTDNQLDFWICSLALRSLGYTTFHISTFPMLEEITLFPKPIVISPGRSPHSQLVSICAQKGLDLVSVAIQDEGELELNSGPHVERIGGHLLRTSGTTGDFKLVLMSPEMDSLFLQRKNEVAGMDQATVLGAFNFPAWTAAGYRWAASPWRVGGTTVLDSSPNFSPVLRQLHLTHAVMVPTILQRALDEPEEAFSRNERLRLTVGGGAMTAAQIEQTHARITPNLFNLLASTEGGVIAHTPIHSTADMRSHSLVKGRCIKVVDEFDQPVEPGAIGRIKVLQDGLPDSYLNNEDATRQCFRDGYFYPGDLASIETDGCLTLQGRASDILNIGGHKISPFPIEQQLSEKLGVTACIFAAISSVGQEELHVVLETDGDFDRGQVAAAMEALSKFIATVQIHSIKKFPRTDTGKVMRANLKSDIFPSIIDDTDSCRKNSYHAG